MSRCSPAMVGEDPAGVAPLTCLDCGRRFLATAEWQTHLEVEHPDSPYRPYDTPLWET